MPTHTTTSGHRIDFDGLRVRVGSAGGKRLRVKCIGELERSGQPDEGILEGVFPGGWTRVGVRTGREDRDRFFELEPAEEENEIAWGPFYVRGRFREVRRENGARRAREAWKVFEPR